MRATNEISQRNYSYGGVLHQGNLELLVQKTNNLQRELEQKTASEKSLEDAVRRLRERETKVRLELAERERSERESRARERAAWRTRARELISDLGEVGLGFRFVWVFDRHSAGASMAGGGLIARCWGWGVSLVLILIREQASFARAVGVR